MIEVVYSGLPPPSALYIHGVTLVTLSVTEDYAQRGTMNKCVMEFLISENKETAGMDSVSLEVILSGKEEKRIFSISD